MADVKDFGPNVPGPEVLSVRGTMMGERTVVIIDTTNGAGKLPMSLDAAKKRGNFNWGYNGTGPTALGHSILMFIFSKKVADNLTFDFVADFIAPLVDQDGQPLKQWSIPTDKIKAWVADKTKGWQVEHLCGDCRQPKQTGGCIGHSGHCPNQYLACGTTDGMSNALCCECAGVLAERGELSIERKS